MIVCGIATMDSRASSLKKVLSCLSYQTVRPDKIVVYNNDQNEFNATDNGKFYYLEHLEEDCYYFSMDDDIYYPPTYIEDMIRAIDLHKCIVTHHGRILRGKDIPYYGGHQSFACMFFNNVVTDIDVAGTGVTAFHTSYFKPKGIFYSEYKRMSDCIFSLEATKQNKTIMVLGHKQNYFKDLCDDIKNSCYMTEHKNQTNQIKIANEIWDLKHQTSK